MQKMNTVVWSDHGIVGHCSMDQKLRDKLNGSQMSFYFSNIKTELTRALHQNNCAVLEQTDQYTLVRIQDDLMSKHYIIFDEKGRCVEQCKTMDEARLIIDNKF